MRSVTVLVLFIVIIFFLGITSAATEFYFKDNFESYPLGYNTIYQKWIPQYASRVSIQQNNQGKYLLIDSLYPYQGDRDVHVAFKKDFFASKRKKVRLTWDFKVVSCNETWKAAKGISPQGSSGYLYYNNPQDFISAEIKVFANSTFCGDGTAQISAFKRVNGTSSALIPYTTYSFEMNKTYNVKLGLEKENYTSYKISIYLDNSLIATSSKILVSDIKTGRFLLENGGTLTSFDNVVIREYK
jgi:hypothetical protein